MSFAAGHLREMNRANDRARQRQARGREIEALLARGEGNRGGGNDGATGVGSGRRAVLQRELSRLNAEQAQEHMSQHGAYRAAEPPAGCAQQ